ncbi:MAG TPA: two-component regulator propeller domain-containing protein [Prolixibacteraceae bacterium]|jgi:hypothetical protein
MLKFKIVLTFLLFSMAMRSGFAQPVIGQWTDYQSYAHAKNVVDTGDKIYCVAEGGLFSYQKSDNSLQKISGVNGLSDVGVQRLAYSKENNLLLIAYQNANIDLLIGTQVFNLSDIKRKQISADKTINNVLFDGNLVYLSCGFGIVVINLDRKEIKDTYFIGREGAYLNVNDMTADGTYLYAATNNGIYKAFKSDPNLQNYNNWILQTSIPHSDKKFSKIEIFKGRIIANYTTDDDQWSGDEMYQLQGNSWTPFLPQIAYLYDVTSTENYLVFSSREFVYLYNDQFELVKTVPRDLFGTKVEEFLSPRSAVIDDQNVIWIADMKYGLIKQGTETETIVPDGPVDSKVFSMTANGNDLWVAAGGWSDDWNNLNVPPQFQLKREGKWSVFDSKDFPVPNNFHDIVCIAVDPKNPDHVFAGSWGGGVLEFLDGTFVNRYDNTNSSLQIQDATDLTAAFVRIGGMDFDSKGNLWVTNTGVANVLSVFNLSTDRTWQSFELKNIANQFSIGKVIVTQNDDKWVMVPRPKEHELYALNSTNEVAKELRLKAYFSNGREELYTPMSDLYSLAEDQNGELWVGTSAGVAVLTNPQKIWDDAPMYATRPGLNLNDGVFHPLLEKETVTAIAIDGANRKWLGTKNSGVFLISADGETEIEHFDTENSPLPRNDISDIAINQNSGEVYIGTSAGLISYMGQATKANDVFTDVYVYPNPVRETYDGPIVVKGLVDNTDVKITDITGNLVYKTTSLGGQAIWDGKNLNGNRCKTGVYLVFMNDPTGDQTKVTKLLFIH